MDGQRLIKINEWGTDSVEYRTETGLDRIVGYDIKTTGPSYFKVYTTGGQILEYGDPNSIASYYPARKYNDGRLHHLGWAIIQISDEKGNFIRFNYESDLKVTSFDEGNLYDYDSARISSIVYGNKYQNTEIVGEIKFHYKAHQNPVTLYIRDTNILNKCILDKIEVTDGRNYTFREYNMNYYIREGNYFLTNIVKSSDDESFLPINFEWTEHDYTYEYNSGSYIGLQSFKDVNSFSIAAYGDIDGDGLTDVLAVYDLKEEIEDCKKYWTLYKNLGNGEFKPIKTEKSKDYEKIVSTYHMWDLDDDGVDELYIGRVGFSVEEFTSVYKYYYKLQCCTSGGLISDFIYSKEIPITEELYSDAHKNGRALNVIAADFRGSGELQFILFSERYKVESALGLDIEHGNVPFGGVKHSNLLFADINGNGKTDVIYVTENGTKFYEYDEGTSSFKELNGFSLTKNELNSYDEIKIGDFNGDGNTDLIINKKNPTRRYLYMSSGYSWKKIDANNILPYGVGSSYYCTILDINKDGKSDIFIGSPNFVNNVATTQTLKMYISTGENFEPFIMDTEAPLMRMLDNHKSNYKNTHGLDIFMPFNKEHPEILSLTKDVWFNKIEKISDSFGNELHITYKDNNVKYSYYSCPKTLSSEDSEEGKIVNNIPLPIEVVDKAEINNSRNSYSFSNPVIHKEGKGFLGFSKTEVRDEINLTSTVSESL
ncbi:VCBS repeat-containing protein, partial [Bacteroidales bacterium OttesenSCG-928-I14]|nr:VCBS repeat-containing protein [Bacteroidales bacterium OttesenSCG-928-I14]